MLNVFAAPALRLVLSDSIGKDRQEDYLRDLLAGVSQDLAAVVARVATGRVEKIARQHRTTVVAEILYMADELKAVLAMPTEPT